ncbi:hypothetical protein X975_19077, partial [Stegodyphus mimosarum]
MKSFPFLPLLVLLVEESALCQGQKITRFTYGILMHKILSKNLKVTQMLYSAVIVILLRILLLQG